MNDIACTGSGNCWTLGGPALGSQNLVERYDGTAWSVDPSAVNAVSVKCFGSGECWAVGSDIDHRTPG